VLPRLPADNRTGRVYAHTRAAMPAMPDPGR